jgi:hypothetical protein
MSMRVGEFSNVFEKAFEAALNLLVVGPSGIGKTQVPTDFCKRKGYDCEAICAPLADPPFFMGYPYRDNGTAGHAPFGVLAKCLKATKPTLLVIDELGGASSATIKSALRLVQFGEVCGQKLPECVRMIALSNDVGHGADVMGIIEPMKDRFISIINVEPHVDDTVAYGLARGWPDWELAFLRNNPTALHDLKPLKSMQRSGATPRGWEGVAKLDKGGFLDTDQGPDFICGAVGKGRGTEALAFRGLVNELPDIDALLLDPESAPVPTNPSAKFLVSTAISSRMSAGNFAQCVKYLSRLEPMFHAFSVRDAFRAEAIRRQEKTLPKDYRAISTSRDFAAWSSSPIGKDITAAGGEK